MVFTLLHGLHVGRLFNIQIYLDWSWAVFTLFVLPLMVYVLQSLVFPLWELGTAALVSVGMLVLALASVLIHQLAHVLVANLEEIPTRQLILYPFGGVSDIQTEPTSPETDTKIALAGPLANAVLASVLLLLIATLNGSMVLTLGSLQTSDPLQFILWWTAALNIFLVVINLLPASPLDGGRVLRALLWQRWNNFQSAQRLSCYIGIGLGWLILVAAFGVALDSALDLGLRILIVLGMVILGVSLKNTALRLIPDSHINPLEGVRIQDFPLSKAQTVSPYLTLQQLANKFIFGTTNRVFVILHSDVLEGVLWLEDVWNVPEEQWKRVLVKHIMTPRERLYVKNPNDSAEAISDILTQRQNRALPIVQDGRFLGMLRRQNVEKWLRTQRQRARARHPAEQAKRLLRFLSRQDIPR